MPTPMLSLAERRVCPRPSSSGGSEASGMRAVPPTLVVTSAERAEPRGEYELVTGVQWQDMPVWDQPGGLGQRIYSDGEGRWLIGTAAVMRSSAGWLISEEHNGRMPHEMRSWEVHVDGTWAQAPGTRIDMTAVQVPWQAKPPAGPPCGVEGCADTGGWPCENCGGLFCLLDRFSHGCNTATSPRLPPATAGPSRRSEPSPQYQRRSEPSRQYQQRPEASAGPSGRGELRAMEKRSAEAEQASGRLRDECARLHAELEAARREADEQRVVAARLQEALRVTSVKAAALEGANAELRARVDARGPHEAAAEQARREGEAERKRLESDREEMAATVDALRAQIDQLTAAAEEDARRREELVEELAMTQALSRRSLRRDAFSQTVEEEDEAGLSSPAARMEIEQKLRRVAFVEASNAELRRQLGEALRSDAEPASPVFTPVVDAVSPPSRWPELPARAAPTTTTPPAETLAPDRVFDPPPPLGAAPPPPPRPQRGDRRSAVTVSRDCGTSTDVAPTADAGVQAVADSCPAAVGTADAPCAERGCQASAETRTVALDSDDSVLRRLADAEHAREKADAAAAGAREAEVALAAALDAERALRSAAESRAAAAERELDGIKSRPTATADTQTLQPDPRNWSGGPVPGGMPWSVDICVGGSETPQCEEIARLTSELAAARQRERDLETAAAAERERLERDAEQQRAAFEEESALLRARADEADAAAAAARDEVGPALERAARSEDSVRFSTLRSAQMDRERAAEAKEWKDAQESLAADAAVARDKLSDLFAVLERERDESSLSADVVLYLGGEWPAFDRADLRSRLCSAGPAVDVVHARPTTARESQSHGGAATRVRLRLPTAPEDDPAAAALLADELVAKLRCPDSPLRGSQTPAVAAETDQWRELLTTQASLAAARKECRESGALLQKSSRLLEREAEAAQRQLAEAAGRERGLQSDVADLKSQLAAVTEESEQRLREVNSKALELRKRDEELSARSHSTPPPSLGPSPADSAAAAAASAPGGCWVALTAPCDWEEPGAAAALASAVAAIASVPPDRVDVLPCPSSGRVTLRLAAPVPVRSAAALARPHTDPCLSPRRLSPGRDDALRLAELERDCLRMRALLRDAEERAAAADAADMRAARADAAAARLETLFSEQRRDGGTGGRSSPDTRPRAAMSPPRRPTTGVQTDGGGFGPLLDCIAEGDWEGAEASLQGDVAASPLLRRVEQEWRTLQASVESWSAACQNQRMITSAVVDAAADAVSAVAANPHTTQPLPLDDAPELRPLIAPLGAVRDSLLAKRQDGGVEGMEAVLKAIAGRGDARNELRAWFPNATAAGWIAVAEIERWTGTWTRRAAVTALGSLQDCRLLARYWLRLCASRAAGASALLFHACANGDARRLERALLASAGRRWYSTLRPLVARVLARRPTAAAATPSTPPVPRRATPGPAAQGTPLTDEVRRIVEETLRVSAAPPPSLAPSASTVSGGTPTLRKVFADLVPDDGSDDASTPPPGRTRRSLDSL